MIKSTLVYDEGIIATEVEMRMIQHDIPIVTVPIFFEEHGFVKTNFFGHFAEELLKKSSNEKNHGKGLRLFVSGNICEENYKQTNGNLSTMKTLTIQDFC